MRRVVTAAVAAVATATCVVSGLPSAAHAAAPASGGWLIASAYTFQAGLPGEAAAQWHTYVSVRAPGWTGHYTATTDVAGGSPQVSYLFPADDGTAVIDVATRARATRVSLTLTDPHGRFLWRQTRATTAGTRTRLTLTRVPRRGFAGATAAVAGTLTTTTGRPLAGHWVQLWERHDQPRGEVYLPVAEAQVGAAGRWATRMRFASNATVYAAYCALPAYCFADPYAAAGTTGHRLTVAWRPTLTVPNRLHSRSAARWAVTVPRGGIRLRLQLLHGGRWVVLASGRSDTHGRAVLRAALPRGRTQVRVSAARQAWTQRLGGTTISRTVEAGTSRVHLVTVP